MNDKELLELAAKAVGIPMLKLYPTGGRGQSGWNPLEDDGDALRLAVQCRLDLMLYSDTKGAFSKGIQHSENGADDPYTATRRAIVRAAAEIGRAM